MNCKQWPVVGLIKVNGKLVGDVENDIKYRDMKLVTSKRILQLILDREDSLYNPGFQKNHTLALLNFGKDVWYFILPSRSG